MLLFFVFLALWLCAYLWLYFLSFCRSFTPLTASRRTPPASVCGSEHLWLHFNLCCYLFSLDQPVITHMEGWLRMWELPGLVAGSLDLPFSICLSLFHSVVASLSFTRPHTGLFIYLVVVNSSFLFTSCSGIQLVHLSHTLTLSPTDVCLHFHLACNSQYQ